MIVTLGLFCIGALIFAVRITQFLSTHGSGGGPLQFGRHLKTFGKHWRHLAPFLASGLTLALAGACPGGLLGDATGWLRGKLGAVGDWGINKSTGSATVTHHVTGGNLSPFGAVVTLIGIAVFIVLWRSAQETAKKELFWGGTCGLTLGPFLGAVALIPLVNWIGGTTIQNPFFS